MLNLKWHFVLQNNRICDLASTITHKEGGNKGILYLKEKHMFSLHFELNLTGRK